MSAVSNEPVMEKQEQDATLGPRENLIGAAVRFLTNPQVINRSLEHKKSFLKTKGLTEDEIRISCERASAYIVPTSPQPIMPIYAPQQVIQSQPTVWTRIRDIVHTLALLGGVGYAIYWVYKTYVEPFLFGRKKPKTKSTDESLSDLEKAVEAVTRNTEELSRETAEFRLEIRSELNRLSTDRDSSSNSRKLNELKSDIGVVKGLLLSRQQFPSAPVVSGIRNASKPSIPAWQLDTHGAEDKEVHDKDVDTDSEEPNEDVGGLVSGNTNGSGDIVQNGNASTLEFLHKEGEVH